MAPSPRMPPRRRLAEHVADACLLLALLLVLGLSLGERPAPARDLGAAAHDAVARQLGAAPRATGVASGTTPARGHARAGNAPG